MSGRPIFPIQPAPLVEAEQFTKPGTANVSAGDRKKLSGLLKHYAKMPHPFTACKRDQIKHGLTPDHANRRCAVIKDLIRGTTKWRSREDEQVAEEIVGEAAALLAATVDELGQPVTERLIAEKVGDFPAAASLCEVASWMIPKAARKPGFKPLDPEKKKGPSDADFEKKHPRGTKGTATGGKFIRKGASNQATTGVQRKLGIKKPSGTFDERTRKRVMQYQRNHGLQVDGIVGAQTAASMLGKSPRKPGELPSGLRHGLKKLGAKGKMREGDLEERTVNVETREDEPGIKIATIPKIRSALYDLSEPRNPTHTVKLPRGTAITVKAGVPLRTYSAFNRTFVITSADGETRREVVGTDDAAEVAKEVDAGLKVATTSG